MLISLHKQATPTPRVRPAGPRAYLPDADPPHSHGQWKGFTDRLFGLRKRAATGAQKFDRLCADLGIEHRLTPPTRSQKNGTVERFIGRIKDVTQSHHFNSREDLEQTLMRYVHLYNT